LTTCGIAQAEGDEKRAGTVGIRTILVAFAATSALLSAIPPASSQTSTTGAVRGTVRDATTGSTLPGVTVVATSPALQGSQAEITDADGRYVLRSRRAQ